MIKPIEGPVIIFRYSLRKNNENCMNRFLTTNRLLNKDIFVKEKDYVQRTK